MKILRKIDLACHVFLRVMRYFIGCYRIRFVLVMLTIFLAPVAVRMTSQSYEVALMFYCLWGLFFFAIFLRCWHLWQVLMGKGRQAMAKVTGYELYYNREGRPYEKMEYSYVIGKKTQQNARHYNFPP